MSDEPRYRVVEVAGYGLAPWGRPSTSFSVIDGVYGTEVAKFYATGGESDQKRQELAVEECDRLNWLDETDSDSHLPHERAVIFAVDELDGTNYILQRPGLPPVSSPWPHALEEICPDAVRIETQGAGIG